MSWPRKWVEWNGRLGVSDGTVTIKSSGRGKVDTVTGKKAKELRGWALARFTWLRKFKVYIKN